MAADHAMINLCCPGMGRKEFSESKERSQINNGLDTLHHRRM